MGKLYEELKAVALRGGAGGGGGFTPTDAQLDAMNSGIDSEKVAQITINTSAISTKANTSDVNTAVANLQGQIDQIVISASSETVVAPEVAAARVGADSTTYTTLKARLDAEQDIQSNAIEDVKDDLHVLCGGLGFDIASMTVTASQEHSSSKDRIFRSVSAGDKIIVSVKSKETLPSSVLYHLYGYSGESSTSITSRAINSSATELTISQDFDSFGIYFTAIGADTEVFFQIDFENSIRKKADAIESELESSTSDIKNEISQLISDAVIVDKEITWNSGYIDTSGEVNASTVSQYAVVQLNAGETVTVGTTNTNITIIGSTDNPTVAVGDTITPIKKTTAVSRFKTYTYTTGIQMYVVICVKASDYTLQFTKSSQYAYKTDLQTISQNFNNTNFDALDNLSIPWEVGVIGNNGENLSSSSRIRMYSPVQMRAGDTIYSPEGYRFAVYIYSDETIASFVKAETTRGSSNESYIVKENCYIRIYIDGVNDISYSSKVVINAHFHTSDLDKLNRKIEDAVKYDAVRYYPVYQNGDITAGNLSNNSTTYKVRTVDFVPTSKVDTIKIDKSVHNYKLYLYYYDSEKVYTGVAITITDSKYDVDKTYPYFKYVVLEDNGSTRVNINSLENGLKIVKESLADDIVEINKQKKAKALALGKKRNNQSREVNTDFRFCLISDIHGEKDRFDRAVKLVNSWGTDLFDAIVNCGDTVYSVSSESLDWYYNIVAKSQLPLLDAIGNHDGRDGVTIPQTTVYNNITANTAERELIVQPDNAATLGLNYYYKDFGDVRLIVLDFMYYDTAEQTWFESVLADSLSNSKSVVCAIHSPFETAECHFLNTYWNYIGTHYRDSNTSNINLAVAVDNFITNGGKFVTWVAGHTHNDEIYTLANHSDQLVIHVNSPYYVGTYTPKSRNPDIYSYDTFNYMSVDTENGVLKILKIGANTDFFGREHNMFVYDYVNKVVLADV